MNILQDQCEIRFGPTGRKHLAAAGISLLAAMRSAGLYIEAPCDGKGTCGKCRVKASGLLSAPDHQEEVHLGAELAEGFRLACKAQVEGDVQAQLPAGTDTFVALDYGEADGFTVCPPVRLFDIGFADGCRPFFAENFPELLRDTAEFFRGDPVGHQVIVKRDKVLDWQVQAERRICGVALDIGTTGVVAELFDLADGASLGTASALNPQTEFGGDVLTRIAFADQAERGIELLRQKIVDCINRLLAELTSQDGCQLGDIYEIVAAGNTTMLHLLLGISPGSLALAPYRPVFTEQLELRPEEVKLTISPRGVVTLLPSASAFVGADITAGLLALGLHRRKQTALFIDIGTNGEIVVVKDGRMVGTSSAAGPALEGMNISCGCRAAVGAIESVAIEADGQVDVRVIGGGQPTGICGSGLIDLVAELVRCGVVEPSGRFARPERLTPGLAARVFLKDNKPAFSLVQDGSVYLTQKDVRQVQLAKGAITAAAVLLLQEAGIGFAELEEVLVAGAFGFHLRSASLVGIGLLPPECEAKIKFVGNTAKAGARAVLLNQQAGRDIVEIAKDLQIRELSLLGEFQDAYVRNLAFPALRG